MNKREQIIKEAEDRARVGGYGHFSFREIADAVGIKSASVHYHFPTKADLGAELARQYTEKFMLSLASQENQNRPVLEVFADQFRHALLVDKKMCLCGMLGAESDALPVQVQQETKAFFEKNIEWLTQALASEKHIDRQDAHKKAINAISILEGALLLSRTLGDNSAFDIVAEQLHQL